MQAAVTTVTQLERQNGVEEELRRYRDAISACELFLAEQQSESERESYRKIVSLLERHKALLADVENWSAGDFDSSPKPPTGDVGGEQALASPPQPWMPALNALLQHTGEARSLLRRGS